MISKFQACIIIFILYILTGILNYWRLTLEDRNGSEALQHILFIITLITGFLSLPLTIPSFMLLTLYTGRVIRQDDRRIKELESENILLRAENGHRY